MIQSPGTFCFHSSISMTISSAWYESCRIILNLKMKINGLLSDPFTLVMLVILQDCPTIFLYVVATKSSPISVIMTRDLRCTDRTPINRKSQLCRWQIFSDKHLLMTNIFWYYKPGIISYCEILEKSHRYTYLLLIIEN